MSKFRIVATVNVGEEVEQRNAQSFLVGMKTGTVSLKDGLEGKFSQDENGLEDGLEEMV